MATRKYWIKFLTWAGRPIEWLGNEQESLSIKIERLENEVRRLKRTYKDNEVHILETVEQNWTSIEISEAKLKALEGNI